VAQSKLESSERLVYPHHETVSAPTTCFHLPSTVAQTALQGFEHKHTMYSIIFLALFFSTLRWHDTSLLHAVSSRGGSSTCDKEDAVTRYVIRSGLKCATVPLLDRVR
jgi:hypothetical protein